MGKLTPILIIFLGVCLAVFVGGHLFFILGIAAIVDGVRSPETVEGITIAWAVFRIIVAWPTALGIVILSIILSRR